MKVDMSLRVVLKHAVIQALRKLAWQKGIPVETESGDWQLMVNSKGHLVLNGTDPKEAPDGCDFPVKISIECEGDF